MPGWPISSGLTIGSAACSSSVLPGHPRTASCCRGHSEWPETQQTRLADRVPRRKTTIALRLDREIDEHDAVLFDDADQQNDADQSD
jgi:hypothetical protein